MSIWAGALVGLVTLGAFGLLYIGWGWYLWRLLPPKFLQDQDVEERHLW